MALPLDDNVLNQLQGDQSGLLDKIDELRTVGVGGLVELPQIVVCGDPSSGKSSVLEAISRVRFPSKATVCTRFATEIVLRRSVDNRFRVSIEPGKSRTDAQELEKLRNFTSESFSGSDLSAIIESAKKCMGISENGILSNSGFSDDVLKVEISGPDRPELTLVDLPGIYHSTSNDQNQDGIKVVQSLTESYIKSSRTIILAVISAKNDFHLQSVLDVAHKFDPEYTRVLGVVTHPDYLHAGSEAEAYYLKLIQNEKVKKLQLGWHVLCNRPFEMMQATDYSRDNHEKEFFNGGRWASVPRQQVGIGSLRHRLSKILLRHICRNLPGLVADIQGKILHHEKALSKMSRSRETVQEQRRFLLDISSKFAHITHQALNGYYVDRFFGGYKAHETKNGKNCSCYLRGNVRALNDSFAYAMSLRGSRRFIHVDVEPKVIVPKGPSAPYLEGWLPQYISRKALAEEIREKARQRQGFELPGNSNQFLVGELFRDQCEPWKAIAETHILNVWNAANAFVQDVLVYFSDDYTCALIMRHTVAPELGKMKQRLLAKLDELISYYQRGHPFPAGDSFLTRLKESREKRQVEVLKNGFGLAGGIFTPPGGKTISIIDLERAANHLQLSDDQFGAEEIIDQMQAYYDTAILTFVENVVILAIENCLLYPLGRLFSSQFVMDMDDQQVQKIAAEPPETQSERRQLNDELEKLRRGKQTLGAFIPTVSASNLASFADTGSAYSDGRNLMPK
ncbi:Dynamin GTPase [Penicillium macrosclerotiorum]|uniref:Dynamin GTPase n=1 Tax=Penicillium macrosclerotiorum TaxID=303699 RepID=UPI002546DAF1|nr:Dynamin GTPase [Penicillium macrosclerotiorum]KAJ5675982.1 Dynamin GTPase [Penicillium macrosclerotiorum]